MMRLWLSFDSTVGLEFKEGIKMKWQKVSAIAATVLIAASVLTACGQNNKSDNAASASGQVLSRSEGDIISTMDTSTMTDAISGQVAVDTIEGLYRYNGSKLEPALALKRVKPTNDGKTYTFKLRKDSVWSNGDKVTAHDFVYAWRRTVDPATKSQYGYLYSGIKNADEIMNGKKAANTLGVKAVDDYTFEVNLAQPIPYFETMMVNPAFFPQNERTVKKYGKAYGTSADKVVYNGPFKLTGWNGTNNQWTEVKNKKYYNAKAVKLSKIKTQVVKDNSTALNLFQSNKLDQVTIGGETAMQMKSDPSYKPVAQSTVSYLELNQAKIPAFKNLKIRQAISKAINRPEFIKNVLGDSSLAAKNLTPRNLAQMPDGTDFSKQAAKSTSDTTTYDKAAAKKLWQEGLKEVGINSLEVEFLTDDSDGAKKSAEYFQSQLQKTLPGLKISITTVPFKSRLTRSENGDFDIVNTLWGADFPDPITFLDLLTSNNSYNDGEWQNAKYDQYIEASKTTHATDAKARFNDLLKAQQILTNDVGVVPIYQRTQSYLVNTKLKQLNYSPANTFNFIHTYFAK